LANSEFVAGDYSIADMAIYPWVVSHDKQGINLADFSQIQRWFQLVGSRPAVIEAYRKAAEISAKPMDDKAKAILFGQGRR